MSQLGAPVIVVRQHAEHPPYYEAKWRIDGRQAKRRLGPAWLERAADGSWSKRRGRLPDGFLDDRAATVLAAQLFEASTVEAADGRERASRITFRQVALEWLHWIEHVKGATPATVRDYTCLLHEPGRPHKRGAGTSPGRIMAAFGDADIRKITPREAIAFLRALDEAGLAPRNVNKHRQTVGNIFVYANREDTYAIARNPIKGTDKRREPMIAALEYYELHEVEALAEAMALGPHRKDPTIAVGDDELVMRAEEDARDADLFRVLLHTGLRIGELRAVKWSAVDLAGRTLLVRIAISAGEEKDPKGRRFRYIPLSTGAVQALERQAERTIFTGRDDYVFCSRMGDRLDDSALRKRYKAACAAAGLRLIKLHGLRHAAGSLLARHGTSVEVRDFMGHAKLSTTDRYVSARFSPEFFERLDTAFHGRGAASYVPDTPRSSTDS